MKFVSAAGMREGEGRAILRHPSLDRALMERAGKGLALAVQSIAKHLEPSDPAVRLLMQGSKHSGFLALDGHATISRDRARIEALWNPIMKTWFTGGQDDPRITVIKVTPTSGYYWDNKHGDLVAATKMVVGAAIGKTLDDSIEGSLRP